MRISPLDVRNQEFKKSLRGFDPEEVKVFLDAIADTMEDFLKEKEAAESELVALKKKVETFTEMEISLRDAMVAAQKAADEAKVNARHNAELMIREAELEVRQRIADAKRQVDDVFRARETVRAEMRAFLPRLRSLLESQLTYLENIEQDVKSMELGNGGGATEAREVCSVTEMVESTARQAETRARDENVREVERAVERREEAAREHAIAAGAHHEPAPQQPAPQQPAVQQPAGQPAGEPGEGEHKETDPLDAAMQQHHERQTGEHEQPAGEHQQPAGEQGQPAGEQGQPAGEQGQPAGEQGQPTGEQGQPTGDHGHPAGDHGQPAGEQGQPTGDHGQPAAEHRAETHEGAAQATGEVSTWRPAPSEGGPESNKELRISHAPQEHSESENRGDVGA